jgi:acido-empty-quinoprotein group A
MSKLRFFLAFALLMTVAPAAALAQELTPAKLLEPLAEEWRTYNGDYSGKRFSSLTQINDSNVHNLALLWARRFTGAAADRVVIKSTPLLVNGILYFTSPNNVWAADARSGHELWHYHYPPNTGSTIGNRGVGIYGNWLYFETPDSHLVSVDAKTGKERWKVEIADPKLDYTSTVAPVVVGNHILVGIGGDHLDNPGLLQSRDPETGDLQWKWFTTPRNGQPGIETWPDEYSAAHGTGQPWIPGTYDPELNLYIVGTGNPNPVMAEKSRKGDNLYTCSIVALNPDTGKLVWYFQLSPHDVHDWDAVETPVIFNAPFDGRPHKLLAQASRNGFFFVLDRTDGKQLVTAPFIHETWASGIDSRGRPVAIPAAAPRPDGALVEPASDGATNWMAPSFDPETRLFYVVARRVFSVFYLTAQGKAEGWAGTDKGLWADSAIRAIDYRTGKIVWDHEIGNGEGSAGILTTAGHLLFTADDSGNLLALDPATGKTLWHVYLGGRMESCPETFELDGRQYLVVSAQNLLFAFALPKSSS